MGYILVVDNLVDDFWVFCSRLCFGVYVVWYKIRWFNDIRCYCIFICYIDMFC